MGDAAFLTLLYLPFISAGMVIHSIRRGFLIGDLLIAFLLVHGIGAIVIYGAGMPAEEAVWLIPAASVLGSYMNLIMAQSQPLLVIPFIVSLTGVVLCSKLVTPGGKRAVALCFAIAVWPFGFGLIIFSGMS